MKLFAISTSLLATANAFAPSHQASTASTTLNLFGGGGGDKEGGDKKPGMMDQLAMFKKAQEMAQKKKELDEELKKEDFKGTTEGCSVNIKYVPVANPMDPNPDYEAVSFEFDDGYFDSASADEIAAACKAAYEDGMKVTNEAVAKKYSVLQESLMEAFGGGAAPPAEG